MMGCFALHLKSSSGTRQTSLTQNYIQVGKLHTCTQHSRTHICYVFCANMETHTHKTHLLALSSAPSWRFSLFICQKSKAVLLTLFRFVAISPISDSQLQTPLRKGQKIAERNIEPPQSQWRFNSFSKFSPPLEQRVLWKGPYATMGVCDDMIYPLWVCVVCHRFLSENHLDYFHLVSPQTLGWGHWDSRENRCFHCTTSISIMCFSVCALLRTEEEKENDFGTEWMQRLKEIVETHKIVWKTCVFCHYWHHFLSKCPWMWNSHNADW